MERFEERAVVLSTVDYGEADRVVTLFTEGRGKISAFAAGARKSRKRFSGALEPFTLLKAKLVERRGDTFRLDGVELLRSFHHLREELPLIARGLYAVELCRELVHEREPYPDLFALLFGYLSALDEKKAGPTSLLAFELSALGQAGFRPRFDRCALCEGDPGPRPRFEPHHGGALCERCNSAFAVEVDPVLLGLLARLQAGERRPLDEELRRRARELLNLFIEHHVGRRLKSVEFMEQVGVD